jgi:ribose transport system permease protein
LGERLGGNRQGPNMVLARITQTARAIHALIGIQNERLVLALAMLAALIVSQSPYFLTTNNLLNIGQAVAVVGVLAVAQTIVIVSGGIDISVGATAGLCAVVAASVIAWSHAGIVGILAALAVGAMCGLVNGLLITAGRVNAFIATLATLSAYEGVALLVSGGKVVGINDAFFNAIGSARPLGIPLPILILTAVAVAAHVLLRYVDWGTHIYAIGANVNAARLAGIPLTRFRLVIYLLSGVAAGLAGIILSARATGASPLQGEGVEFDVITATILGGAALAGGRGTIAGTLIGVLILGTLYNGLILAQIPTFYQYIAKGGLLAVAVVIQEHRRPR